MTMFTLPNFCRVCLKYDKNLIDLAHIENEPSETLMNKLQHCVSEVEWTLFKPLLCHPCIKRLNIAYSFKKQCVQSAGVLKNYVELVKESQQKKTESQNAVKAENLISATGGAYMLLPNQKYVKILVGAQNQGSNTFQNVFLNLIPANTLTPVLAPPSDSTNSTKNKDSNQNVFLNLNNTFQKLVPVSQAAEVKKTVEVQKSNLNVNQLLTQSKSEELSVEIDPTIFGLEEDDDDDDSRDEEEANDYDEVISQAKITLKDFKSNGEKVQNGKDDQKFVPILPKTQDDFFSSGQHFLFSQSENSGAFACESCQKTFATKKLLKAHFNQFHMGKLPFKCEYCYAEFTTRNEYDSCRKSHKLKFNNETSNKSITLQDFTNNSPTLNDLQLSELEAHIQPTENGEYICDVCRRPFNSSTGLLRHKVRKHNQKNKKKYFIKGMKNARCDICNREFSTQSYMQLHKKLHMRDDIGYKYKVFGKSKYGDLEVGDETNDNKSDENIRLETSMDDSNVENLDVTPDIFTEDDDRKSDDESVKEERDEIKDEKMDVDEENGSENETEDDEPIEEEIKDTETEETKNCDVKEEVTN